MKTRTGRHGLVAGTVAALVGGGVLAAAPASASVYAGYIDISATGSRVTAHLYFNSRTSFTLTDVTLYDTKCDARSAKFAAYDDYGGLTIHTDSSGCGTHVHWDSLTGTSNGGDHITKVWLETWSESTGNLTTPVDSGKFSNPYR